MIDVLAFGAHPDDIELAYGGTLARLSEEGRSIALVDLTAGERGSRGDVETRLQEAAAARERIGAATRECLSLPDLGLRSDEATHRRRVIEAIRRLRPRLVLAPHPEEGHPDHREASRMIELACEESRFWRVEAEGERHIVEQLLFSWPAAGATQSGGAGGGGSFGGGFVVDVTSTFEKKREALLSYRSQFEANPGPETRLAAGEFLELVEARARVAGAAVGVRFGEGFVWRGALSLAALTRSGLAGEVPAGEKRS